MTATDRIDERLSSARSAGRCALLPYFTSGFPDQATTAELIVAADAVGASVIELGMPFSDSIADGPVIQSSFNYALARGHRVEDVFDVVREVRPSVGCALTAMLSYSIVHRVARIIQCAFSRRTKSLGDFRAVPTARTRFFDARKPSASEKCG